MAFLYLITTIIFGVSLIALWVNTESIYETISGKTYSKKVPKLLFIIPAGITVGIMTLTFINYFIIYVLNKITQNNNTSYPIGITLTLISFFILTIRNFYKIRQKKEQIKNVYEKKTIVYYSIVAIIVLISVGFIMIYSFRMKDNVLQIGSGVYGDLAVHTAMTSSFGVGGNIPTQYMHFSGDGINWHFFFYFFAGLLNYLGMPIDLAINIPSILTMFSALMLLGLISNLLSKNKLAFLIAPILVFFRSSLNIFFEIEKIIANNGNIIESIVKNKDWLDVAPYDSWGFWTLNIYTNQRHFMIGISVIIMMVIFFIPYVIEMTKSLKEKKLKEKIKYFFIGKDTWKIDLKDKRLFIGLLLIIALPYFHGSALITTLIVLFIFAIFSKNRLSYLILAVVAIVASLIQTNIFSNAMSKSLDIKFQYGFILGQVSLFEIIRYIFIITGIMSIVCLIQIVKGKENRLLYSILFLSFIFPIILAFTFKFTIEMHNNQKFIQFSLILLDMLVAALVARLINNNDKTEKYFKMYLGIVLLIILTITGIGEFFIFKNKNKDSYIINTKSDIVQWVKENTEKEDVFLTPQWTAQEFFLAGRQIFFGWPYYAWACGHDTNARKVEYEYLLQGCNENKDEFIKNCKKHNIKYVIDCIGMFDTKNEATKISYYNQQFIQNNFKMVAEFEQKRIYQIY